MHRTEYLPPSSDDDCRPLHDYTRSAEENLETLRGPSKAPSATCGTVDPTMDALLGNAQPTPASLEASARAAAIEARNEAILSVVDEKGFTERWIRAVTQQYVGEQVGSAVGTLRNLFK